MATQNARYKQKDSSASPNSQSEEHAHAELVERHRVVFLRCSKS